MAGAEIFRSSLETLSGPTLLPDGRERSGEATSKDDTGENWKPLLVTEEDFSRNEQHGKAAGEEVEHCRQKWALKTSAFSCGQVWRNFTPGCPAAGFLCPLPPVAMAWIQLSISEDSAEVMEVRSLGNS